jgi:hypothetical protein
VPTCRKLLFNLPEKKIHKRGDSSKSEPMVCLLARLMNPTACHKTYQETARCGEILEIFNNSDNSFMLVKTL